MKKPGHFIQYSVLVALTAQIIIFNDLLQPKYTMHFHNIVNIAFYTQAGVIQSQDDKSAQGSMSGHPRVQNLGSSTNAIAPPPTKREKNTKKKHLIFNCKIHQPIPTNQTFYHRFYQFYEYFQRLQDNSLHNTHFIKPYRNPVNFYSESR